MMKLISRNTDYAIRAVCYIARHKEDVVTAADLFKALGIPRSFLRKILQVLNRENILVSHKGKGGGFRLAHTANRIFLMDIVKAFQGPFKLNECTFKKEICPNKRSCWLKKKIDSVEAMVYEELKGINVSSILKDGQA